MSQISIISDDVYAKIGLEELVLSLSPITPLSVKKIYSFEKTWINEKEIKSLLASQESLVLILAHNSLLTFLSSLKLPEYITLGSYNGNLKALQTHINLFLNEKRKHKAEEYKKKLTHQEYLVIEMYLKGQSLHIISRQLNRSYKTIYAHKRNAMKKMGIKTVIDLVQKKQSILAATKFNMI